MTQSIRDIYADYRYDMLETARALKDLSLEEAASTDAAEHLLARAERLEALIDLYAYLLACQGGNSRR